MALVIRVFCRLRDLLLSQKIIQISSDGNISPGVRVAGACSSEAVREKGEEKDMVKTSRQINSYHRSFRVS